MNQEPQISVGILSSKQIKFALNGEYRMSESATQSGALTNANFAEYVDGQIRFQNKLFGELLFEPENNDNTFELEDVTIGVDFHWQRKENQIFKGALKIIVEGNKLTAINLIHVEDYLYSVISSEMSATASIELLKAHAVISRSWLLANIKSKNQKSVHQSRNPDEHIVWYERDAHKHYDVCADDHCQRYQGLTRACTPLVKQAIDETRGLVLMSDGEICDARFSKCCGGASELFESCWADEHHSYLEPVRDAEFSTLYDLTQEENAEAWILGNPKSFCNTTDAKVLSQVLNNYDQETPDFYRWHVTYSQNELSEIVKQRSGIDFGLITDLIPVERGASGRLIKLKIVGTKQTLIIGKELEIRKWLSTSHLYSSAFVVEKQNDTFIIKGAGWGHGVGLCQIGAAVMGEKGYHYDEILRHYFKNTELNRIY